MQIRVEIRGRGLQEMLRLTERVGHIDRAALMRRLGQKVLAQHQLRIISEKTDPSGKAWASLMPSTIAEKGNSNILIRTGAMAAGFRLASTAMTATVSNGTSYLKYHQGGTRKMVQRRPMGLSARNIAELQAILNQTIQSLMR